MISVAAIRMQQFGVQFYQASLTANDIDKLVRFEVLDYNSHGQAPVRGGKSRRPSRRSGGICSSDASRRARRPISDTSSGAKSKSSSSITNSADRRAICPPFPAPSSSQPTRSCRSTRSKPGSLLGRLKVPEREGVLRAIDGQHRLLALHADIDNFADEQFTVPAIIFDRLPEDHVVQMFVTINAKHTRLNSSHLVSLSGRQLYRDESLAAAHDVVRALNDREESPLYGDIKLLGVGRGRVAQAPLAQEFKRLFANEEALGGARKAAEFRDEAAKRFFVNYFKQIATLFESAWNGRKYSIRSATALRAFIRVAPDVIQRIDQQHADRTDSRAIGRVIAPWDRRIGSLRFETDGAWKRQVTTVDRWRRNCGWRCSIRKARCRRLKAE